MSNKADQNIRERLEAYTANVSPSKAELKRFNESLDKLPHKEFNWRKYTWLLLLLFLLTNGWLLLKNFSLTKNLHEQINEVSLLHRENETLSRLQHNEKFEQRLIDSLQQIVLRNNKGKSNNGSEAEDANTVTIDREYLRYLQSLSDFGKSNKNTGNGSSSNYGLAANGVGAISTTSNLSGGTLSTGNEENGSHSLGNSLENGFEPNTLNGSHRSIGPRKSMKKLIEEKIANGIIAIDSNTTNPPLADSAVEKTAEKAKVKAKEDKPKVIKQPLPLGWHITAGMHESYINTYLINKQRPFAALLMAGLDYGKFSFSTGIGIQFLSFNEAEHQKLRYDASLLHILPHEGEYELHELTARGYSLYLPLEVSYHWSKTHPLLYTRGATNLHLYSMQHFKIEGEHADYLIDQSYAKNSIYYSNLGVGTGVMLGKLFKIEMEGGVQFGAGNFYPLLRQKFGVYAQLRFSLLK
ncbi:hypothetical protein GC194_11775 [bacterium]|nr:hypothetical protein [bacterium]